MNCDNQSINYSDVCQKCSAFCYWKEKELKEEFECHFRADKDYDLKYQKQLKELKETQKADFYLILETINNRTKMIMDNRRVLGIIVKDYYEETFKEHMVDSLKGEKEVDIDLVGGVHNKREPKDISIASKPNCNKCELYGECDHQEAYCKDGKWCYETTDSKPPSCEFYKKEYCPPCPDNYYDCDLVKIGNQIRLDKTNEKILENEPKEMRAMSIHCTDPNCDALNQGKGNQLMANIKELIQNDPITEADQGGCMGDNIPEGFDIIKEVKKEMEKSLDIYPNFHTKAKGWYGNHCGCEKCKSFRKVKKEGWTPVKNEDLDFLIAGSNLYYKDELDISVNKKRAARLRKEYARQ